MIMSIVGLVFLIFGISLFKQGNYDGGVIWPIVGIFLIYGGIMTFSEKMKKDEDEKRRKEEENARQIQLKMSRQKESYVAIVTLCDTSISLFEAIPRHLESAEKHLDQAESDFSDSAFSPFWDSIENAVKNLDAVSQCIKQIKNNYFRYADLIKCQEEGSQKFPIARQSFDKLVVSTTPVERLQAIVRTAQRDFHFSTIYEQRKTNKILTAGFTTLAQALDNMTLQLTESINNLTSSVDSITSTLNESIHSKLRDIESANAQYYSTSRTSELERAKREKRH